MSLKMMNEAFKRKYENVLTEEEEEYRDEIELRHKLYEVAKDLSSKGVYNLKQYEIAFQDAIEDMFPDHSWWEVTDCNIFMELLNTRDVMSTIDTIIDELNEDVLDKYSFSPSIDEAKENRPLYIIKDSHGNQLSAPNPNDEELWDRVASMEARGRRGLCVVAYTGKKESDVSGKQTYESLNRNKHNKIKESKLKHTSTRNKKLRESVNHKSHKRLNEGPGAGYTIESSGYRLNGTLIDFKKYEDDGDTVYVCKVNLKGTVDSFEAHGYYAGTGEQSDLKIKCNEVTLAYPGKVDDMSKDELLENILYELSDASCKFTYGGGWSHSTYDGQLTDDDWLDGFYAIKAQIWLDDEDDISKVDRMVQGYGYETAYGVVYDHTIEDTFESESEAIEYAKEINADSVIEVFETEDWDENIDFDTGSIVWRNTEDDDEDDDDDEVDESLKKSHIRNNLKHKKLKESPSYEMRPQHDARKSFYGKARVDDENGVKTLYSYDTPVAKIDNGKVELLPKWESSQTTLRHVKEFLKQNGFKADSLAQMKKDYK